jgi:hypothetical protein
MQLIVSIGIRVLEFIFVIGVLGCTIVLILTLIEDAKMLFGRDEKVFTPAVIEPSSDLPHFPNQNPSTRTAR